MNEGTNITSVLICVPGTIEPLDNYVAGSDNTISINNTEISIDLYTTNGPWTGNGNYDIYIQYDSSLGKKASNKSIGPGATPIAWSDFGAYP
jgi:hypothetical protein